MAITTSSSINVKPWRAAFRVFIGPRVWPNCGAHSSAVCASVSRAGLHQAPRFLPLLHRMEERVGRGGAFLLVSPLLGPPPLVPRGERMERLRQPCLARLGSGYALMFVRFSAALVSQAAAPPGRGPGREPRSSPRA